MLDRKSIQSIDTRNMLSSIEVLDKQCMEAWESTSRMQLPAEYASAQRIVLFGMGGSALGMDVVRTLFQKELRVPIDIVNDYIVPGYVDEDTLVILSSYSGTTEEVLVAAQEAAQKTKKIFVIATGGDLAAMAQQQHWPAYIFSPTYNPCNQPRMAIGYSVVGVMGVLTALGYLNVTMDQIQRVASHLQELHRVYGADVPEEQNPIKQLAFACENTFPLFISSEFLVGSTHALTNQVHENGKHFAARFPIPELNHHLMEGIVFPRSVLDHVLLVFITSTLYHPRNQMRYVVTANIAARNNITHTTLALRGETPMEQAFELLLAGGYLSVYLAAVHHSDPSPIPNVDYFKDALKKS